MDWQLTIVIILAAAAIWYLLWTAWCSWKGTKTGCEKGCGCGAAPENAENNGLISSENLQLRQRPVDR